MIPKDIILTICNPSSQRFFFELVVAPQFRKRQEKVRLVLYHPKVALHTETSHLICTSNQIIGFYKKCNTGLTWVNEKTICISVFQIKYPYYYTKKLYAFLFSRSNILTTTRRTMLSIFLINNETQCRKVRYNL